MQQDVTTPDQVVGLTGYEITGTLDTTSLWVGGYSNVDLTIGSGYTDVRHVNQTG